MAGSSWFRRGIFARMAERAKASMALRFNVDVECRHKGGRD